MDENQEKARINYSEEEQEYIQKIARDLDAALRLDNGNYINSCLSRAIESNSDRQAFEQLIKSLQYNYSNNIIEFILSLLINPPFVAHETKKYIKEQNVIEFIDYLVFHFSGKIYNIYKINYGETDWQNIKSDPIIRQEGVALSVDILLANGEKKYFTAPLKTVPIVIFHFLKHINRSVDFLGERAISEISPNELLKIGKELEKLSEKIKKHTESKLDNVDESPADDQ